MPSGYAVGKLSKEASEKEASERWQRTGNKYPGTYNHAGSLHEKTDGDEELHRRFGGKGI